MAGVVTVNFLDVGQGEGNLISTSDGHAWLIDYGTMRSPSISAKPEARIIEVLAANAKIRGSGDEWIIDGLFISHADRDHYNLVVDFIACVTEGLGKKLTIAHIWTSGPKRAYSDAFRLLLDVAEQAGSLSQYTGNATYATVDKGSLTPIVRHRVGGKDLTLTLLAANLPLADAQAAARAAVVYTKVGTKKNVGSLVLLLEYAGRKVIFPGDAEVGTEAAIVANLTMQGVAAVLRKSIIKVGHHGSAIAASAVWLDATLPIAVMASASDLWAHPYCETLQRIVVPTHRTPPEKLFAHRWVCGKNSGEAKIYDNHVSNLGAYTSIWGYIPASASSFDSKAGGKNLIGQGVNYELTIAEDGSMSIINSLREGGTFSPEGISPLPEGML
jgi:beta-lactamase superfamily II metal-dependent hydrolase